MTFRIFAKSLLATFLLAFSLVSVQAQSDAAPTKKAKPAASAQRGQKPETDDDDYSKDLNLTEEQKAKFKAIDDEYKAKRKAAKTASKEEVEAMRQARIKAHKEALNAEQLKRYDDMQARKEARRAAKAQQKAEMKSGKAAKKSEKGADKDMKKAQKESSKEMKKEEVKKPEGGMRSKQ
ncbi:MAG TPA: hypothetical protein PK971_12835 [Saprospiraceae bacterium]|nr:hypothetical protein [Saprospiraceae bacterium]